MELFPQPFDPEATQVLPATVSWHLSFSLPRDFARLNRAQLPVSPLDGLDRTEPGRYAAEVTA